MFRKLVAVLVAALAVAVVSPTPVAAAVFNCKSGNGGPNTTCSFSATCTGDGFRWTNTCSMQCMTQGPGPNEWQNAGICSCGSLVPTGEGGGEDGWE